MLNCNQEYNQYITDARAQYLRINISMHGHNKKKLARKMGITLNTLTVHLRQCGIKVEDYEVIA